MSKHWWTWRYIPVEVFPIAPLVYVFLSLGLLTPSVLKPNSRYFGGWREAETSAQPSFLSVGLVRCTSCLRGLGSCYLKSILPSLFSSISPLLRLSDNNHQRAPATDEWFTARPPSIPSVLTPYLCPPVSITTSPTSTHFFNFSNPSSPICSPQRRID